MTTAHAIRSFGKINVATVSPTPRGAIVNWLVVDARIMVLQSDSDELIAATFRQLQGQDHKLVEVDVIERSEETNRATVSKLATE